MTRLKRYGLGLLPYYPLASGMLSGKYQRGQEPPEGARFADQTNPLYRRRLNDRIYDVIDGLQPIADDKGITLSQMALAWVLRDKAMTSVLIGASKMEQIDDAVGALERLEFSENELREIDEILSK